MLVFLIAVAGTAGLGVLATKVPAVQAHLGQFSKWAGLFMQIAGVLEAMRRLTQFGDKTFNVNPSSPTVTMQGTSSTLATVAKPPTVTVGVNVPVINEEEDAPKTERERYVDGVAEVIAKHTVQTYMDKPGLPDKIKARLQEQLYFTPSGDIDKEAIFNDPVAEKALDLWYRVDALQEAAAHGGHFNEEPLDVSKVIM